MTYVLHYAPDNASLIVRLALEELGQPYETRLVDRGARAQKSPAYRALNPAGLIPVLETPAGALFETGAILLWLADRHPEAQPPADTNAPTQPRGALAPPPQDPARGDFLKWLFFTSNTLHPALRMTFYPALYAGPDPAHQTALRHTMQAALRQHWSLLDNVAQHGHGWLGSDHPSGLDVYLACLLRWSALYPVGHTGGFDLASYPGLAQMAARLEPRPAVQRAVAAEGLGPAPFTAPRHAIPPEGSAT